MVKRPGIYIYCLAAAIIIVACKKAFTPQASSVNNRFLVVEGFINTGGDSTQIKLSRTVKLTDTTKLNPELKANLFIEDDKNNKYAFKDLGLGIYKCPPFAVNAANTYRLHIYTANSGEYISDFVKSYTSPPIDSLNYKELSTGLQFYTSTHDPTNTTKYYRWDFDETWEYTANEGALPPTFIYDLKGDTVRFRNPNTENITYCWVNTKSNTIVLASTEGLSQSVINQQAIAYVDVSTYKLKKGYSMLLHQYSLSREAYEYWQKLKKNTEQLGSIFDAQPSDLAGNLHSISNPAQPVFGYISASNVASKRIFIDSHNISIYQPPPHEIPVPGNPDCGVHAILFEPKATLAARLQRTLGAGDTVIIDGIFNDATKQQIGYKVSRVLCADCTKKLSYGTNARPSYWPANL